MTPPPVPTSKPAVGPFLLKVIGGWIAWGEQHLPYGINNWPKWSNEGLGGVVELFLIWLPALHWSLWWWVAYPLYTVFSYGYEAVLDPYGKIPAPAAWGDFIWRQVGATILFALLLWLR